jgi:hypothetical protein
MVFMWNGPYGLPTMKTLFAGAQTVRWSRRFLAAEAA